MTRAILRITIAALVVGGAVIYWIGLPPNSPKAARPNLVVVVSGDTAGWITPCGCASNQSGGLARRGGYLESIQGDGAVFYADAGGALTGDSKYQRIKFEAILRGERAAGIVAHNLGTAEAKLGPKVLREIAVTAGVKFVSSNLVAEDGLPVAEPYVLAEKDGWKVAFLGVLSAKSPPPGFRLEDPRTAVSTLTSELRSQCDAVVVLAYMPADELREFARETPEVDLVIGGPTAQSIPPERVGPVLVASSTNKGKFLARLEREPLANAPWTGSIVEVKATFSELEAQLRNVAELQALLAKLDLAPEDAGLQAEGVGGFPSNYRIAGSESCRSCHANDCKLWDDSKHAIAWKTLIEKKTAGDPSCRQCHSTGYGLPGGFRTEKESMDRVKVGCESCHGPSQAHVYDPKTRTPFAAKDRCVSCHDHENSPTFDYDKFWSKIVHGKSPATGGKR
jgi:hypothetical protein